MKIETMVFLFVAAILCSTTVDAETVVLTTPQGKLEGQTSLRNGDIAVFKHIPYALPPLGQRRFQHAEPAPDWQGTRLATQYSPACLQPAYPAESFYARATEPTSEDCLYLNVWTPSAAMPVSYTHLTLPTKA